MPIVTIVWIIGVVDTTPMKMAMIAITENHVVKGYSFTRYPPGSATLRDFKCPTAIINQMNKTV